MVITKHQQQDTHSPDTSTMEREQIFPYTINNQAWLIA